MIKSLYPPFRKWTEKGALWVYSDPHFSDPEMPNLRKNYITDEEQVSRINAKVGKNDTIIFLGDIGNVDMIRHIRGYKVLIMGNHDKGATNYERKKNRYMGVDENGNFIFVDNRLFDEVYEGPLFISDRLLLSHEPIDLPFAFNIHGHDHSNDLRDHHLNVCAEWINYTPVNINQLIKTGELSKVDSIHRITIDRANERKIEEEMRRERDKFFIDQFRLKKEKGNAN